MLKGETTRVFSRLQRLSCCVLYETHAFLDMISIITCIIYLREGPFFDGIYFPPWFFVIFWKYTWFNSMTCPRGMISTYYTIAYLSRFCTWRFCAFVHLIRGYNSCNWKVLRGFILQTITNNLKQLLTNTCHLYWFRKQVSHVLLAFCQNNLS